MEEKERNNKTSRARLKANSNYRKKCIKKEIMFYPSELDLLDKAEDKALEEEKSFTKYVKDLIRDDVSDSEQCLF